MSGTRSLPGDGYVRGGSSGYVRTWDLGHNRIRSASGQYTSYWNAFLFLYSLSLLNVNIKLDSLRTHLKAMSLADRRGCQGCAPRVQFILLSSSFRQKFAK